MAWNEPGGGRNNDPWGGRGGDQGPPDLDEAFRKLQGQLGRIFSGKGKRGGGAGGGGSGNPLGNYSLPLLLFVIVAVWFFLGVRFVNQQERGVVFRFGKLQEEIKMPGLRWFPRLIDSVEFVNVTAVNSIEMTKPMLSEDENIVEVSLKVQWLVGEPKDYVVNVRDPHNSMVQATESALRHVIGSSTMDSIITEGREAIAIDVQARLQTYLDRYGTGITVSKVNIDRSGPPQQVKAAFDDVQKAKEDEQRAVNEANAYAESILPVARGEAQRAIEESNAYLGRVVARSEGDADRFVKLLQEYQRAKAVTRDRLYIDAMESVLTNTSKVIIDVDGGNNVLYLPLDKILEQSRAAGPRNTDNGSMDRDSDTATGERAMPPRTGR